MQSNKLTFLNLILTNAGITSFLFKKHRYVALRFVYQGIVLMFIIILNILQAIYITQQVELEVFTHALACTFTGSNCVAKLFCYMVHRDEIKDIIDAIIYEDCATRINIVSHSIEKASLGPKSAELVALVKDTNDKLFNGVDILVKLYAVLTGFTALLFSLQAIVRGVLYPDEHARELPFSIYSPWDDKKSPNYELTFIMQSMAGVLCGHVYAGVDSAFALFSGQIIRQLRILRYILENLSELVAEVDEMDTDEWERDCTIVLADCAKHYAWLRRLTERLNVIHKPSFLWQVIVASLTMCMCMFQIVTAESVVKALNFYTLYLTVFLQNFGCSAVIQHLKTESTNLQYCLMEDWWLHRRPYHSSVKILQGHLQQPLTMHIWGSIEYSIPTFGAIVKTSMSYLALLRSTAEGSSI